MSEPIWFTFTRIELAVPVSMPFCRNFTLVTNRSSPTSWILSPSVSVSFFQPSQSLSAQPSSMEMIGIFRRELLVEVDQLVAGARRPVDFLKM